MNLLLKILSALMKWAAKKPKVQEKLDLNKNDKCDLIEWAEWIDNCLEEKEGE